MISKTQEYQGFHMIPRIISSVITNIFNISYGTPYDFLRITKILKKSYGTLYDFFRKYKKKSKFHMVLPMVSSKINKKVTLSHDNLYKNIQIEFLKCLYIPPPWNFEKSDLRGGGI